MRLIGRRSTEDYEKPDDNNSVKDLLGLMINASTNLKANKHPVEPITVLDLNPAELHNFCVCWCAPSRSAPKLGLGGGRLGVGL